MTRRATLVLAALTLMFLLIFVWTENQIAPSFHHCISENAGEQAAESAKDYRLIVAGFIKAQSVCSLRLLDHHNGFFAALATVLISIFTVVLVIVTGRQARLTAESVGIAKRALTDIERAFIFIDGFNVELTTAADADVIDIMNLPKPYQTDRGLYITRFAVQPRWKNGWNTPTKNMTIRVNWGGPEWPIPPEFTYRNNPTSFFVAPKAVESTEFIEIPPAPKIVDYQMHYLGAEPMILIWGRADYDDVFERRHFVEWCYRLRLSRPGRGERMRAGFVQWGDYNRTGEID